MSVKKLEISDKVVFTGFISREERLKLVAESKLMLYPSHIDSYSYAVLEAFFLGTPVVAYDIPAIRLYHSSNPGIAIVPEGDIEAFTTTTLDFLESTNISEPEIPKIRRWNEISEEEVNLIRRYLSSGVNI
jgi:glycosyltransferase involved in cell wall biosynthesis